MATPTVSTVAQNIVDALKGLNPEITGDAEAEAVAKWEAIIGALFVSDMKFSSVDGGSKVTALAIETGVTPATVNLSTHLHATTGAPPAPTAPPTPGT